VSEAPRVSVVVPTHNRRFLVELAVDAVLGQRGVDVELIVVDEASSDGTAEWLDALAERDARLRVIHHASPQGLPAARNAGIRAASASWLAFCDDDDLWAPDKLAAQLVVLEQSGSAWCTTGTVLVDPRLEVIGFQRVDAATVRADLPWRNPVPGGGSSVLARRDLVEDAGLFDESLRASEDWDLWCRCAQRSPIAIVDRPLVAYRIGPASMSMDVDRMREACDTVRSRYEGVGAAPRDDFDQEQFYAYQFVRQGRRGASSRAYLRLAARHRDGRSLVRALASAVSPGLMRRVGQLSARRGVPEAWREEAENWLSPLRDRVTERAERRAG
jgi:glycosyltransferase involved in cell wall biosynthesis